MLLTVTHGCTSWMYISSCIWGVGMGYHPNRPFVADNKSLFSSLHVGKLNRVGTGQSKKIKDEGPEILKKMSKMILKA